MKWLHYLMAGIFTLSALVQVNDPDPLAWIAVYLAAALICLAAARDRAVRVPAAVTALVACGWALALAPRVLGEVSFFELFDDIRMKSAAVEFGREMGGLIITGLWMSIAAWPGGRGEENADEQP